jgi:hypothetical protein
MERTSFLHSTRSAFSLQHYRKKSMEGIKRLERRVEEKRLEVVCTR